MTVLDGNTVGVRAHLHRRECDGSVGVPAEELLHLLLELGLFIRNVGNDVPENVEGCYPGIAGAGYRLHRHQEEFLDTEALLERREGECGYGGRAVCVRHDSARPAALSPLPVEQREMARVHFGYHQWNILFHAEVLRVAEDELSRLGKIALDVAGDRRVEGRECDGGRDA